MRANNSARLLVCSRPGKVKEQFLSSLMLKNTPATCSSEPRVLLQTHAPSVQAMTQSWFWVSLSNLTSDKTLSGKVLQRIDCAHALGSLSAQATDSGSSRNMPHFEVQAKLFPPRAPPRAYALHLQVPHHKTDRGDSALWQSNCLFCVQTQSQEAHGDRFVAREESWYCSSLWWWPACRCQQWTRCLSCRYICFSFLYSASLSPCEEYISNYRKWLRKLHVYSTNINTSDEDKHDTKLHNINNKFTNTYTRKLHNQ